MASTSSHRGCSALIAASLATALAATPPAAAQQPDPDMQERMIAYSQCIRDNGYAEFPDPDANGRLQFQLESPAAAPRFQAAQEACKDLSPFGFASGPPSPEEMEQLVQFAQCVRDNGVAEFPDPNSEGVFSLRDADIEIEGPTMRSAVETCRQAEGAAGGARIMIGG